MNKIHLWLYFSEKITRIMDDIKDNICPATGMNEWQRTHQKVLQFITMHFAEFFYGKNSIMVS